MQGPLKMKLVLSFNFTFCYDYFLSLNNSKLGDFVDRLYPIELEIKDTTNTARFASFFYLCIAICIEGLSKTTVFDKRYDCNFLIVNFPFICNNIPAPAACEFLAIL